MSALSAPSIAAIHFLYRYYFFDEICIGAEVCHPHPSSASRNVIRLNIIITIEQKFL